MKNLLALTGFAALLAGCSAPDYGRGGAAYEGNVYHNSHDPAYFHGGETNVTRNAPISPDVAPLVETNTPPTPPLPAPDIEPVPAPTTEPLPEPVPVPDTESNP